MKPRDRISTWKSPEAERRFRALEDRFWHEHWPELDAVLEGMVPVTRSR